MGYLKFAMAVAATVASAIVAALTGDQVVDTVEWINVVIVGFGAVGVLGAGNTPAGVWKYMKGYVAAATTAAIFLTSIYTGGIDTSELIQLIFVFIGALGVVAVPGPVVQAEIDRYRPTAI